MLDDNMTAIYQVGVLIFDKYVTTGKVNQS